MTDPTPYPATPAPPPAAAPAPTNENPGGTLGIVALILAIFFSIVGAIIGFVARSKSKRAGFGNGPAVAAIIIGLVLFVIQIVVVIALVVGGIAAFNVIKAECNELGSGVHHVNGVTYTCG
jgi:heme/copper-type cytochrome/quinol oxidase subunit 2